MIASRRPLRWTIVMALGIGACGGDDPRPLPSMLDLLPDDNEVSGWIEDTSRGTPGPQVSGSVAEVTGWINGDADPFAARRFAALGREFYTSGPYSAELRIWQMPDAATAADVYAGLLVEDAQYGGATWISLSMGDAARFADLGAVWWFNVRKGPFHIELSDVTDSAAGRAAAETFLSAILAKIP